MSYDPHGPGGQNPYPQQPYQGAGFRRSESNGMGIAGLIISIVGLLVTCGLLCPLGLLLSMIGLTKRPRGEAIAGTIIGGIGTLGVASVVGFFMLAAATAGKALEEVANRDETRVAIYAAESDIEEYRFENDKLPGGIEGNKLIINHTDAWGTSLRYDLDGKSYQIRSAGPDKEFDTDDDMTEDDFMLDYVDEADEYGDPIMEEEGLDAASDESFDAAFEKATSAGDDTEAEFGIDLE